MKRRGGRRKMKTREMSKQSWPPCGVMRGHSRGSRGSSSTSWRRCRAPWARMPAACSPDVPRRNPSACPPPRPRTPRRPQSRASAIAEQRQSPRRLHSICTSEVIMEFKQVFPKSLQLTKTATESQCTCPTRWKFSRREHRLLHKFSALIRETSRNLTKGTKFTWHWKRSLWQQIANSDYEYHCQIRVAYIYTAKWEKKWVVKPTAMEVWEQLTTHRARTHWIMAQYSVWNPRL